MVSPLFKTGAPKSPEPASKTTGPSSDVAEAVAEPSFAPAAFSIGRARGLALGEATALLANDTILSTFPLHDLGQIETTGRAATGFRLDGGALRLMWLTAQRIREPEKGEGFELSFFAHAGMIQTLESRLAEKKATSGKLLYSNRELDPDAQPMAQRLVSETKTWGPNSASTLRLEQPGQFELELVTGKAEALKGAVRIRVYGNDAAATKHLQQVVSQLGLQKLFAPPKPADLERLELFRFLWHFAPETLGALKFRPASDIDEKSLDLALSKAGVTDQDPLAKIADAAPTDGPVLGEYYALMHLLAERDPEAFHAWARQNLNWSRGLVPPPDAGPSLESLRAKAKAAGLDLEESSIKAGLEAPAPPKLVRRYLDLGILLVKDANAAERLLSADIDAISVERLRALLTKVGFDPASDRIKGLCFAEVYPGYFTVLDPTQPERLAELGARYLYSTAESPQRVLDLLTEGQKSSATRFREGRMVQGKSTDADFGSGGAFSVFTRIVTASAINKKSSFGDWGGSRPYKVILSRDILARLDWYGYNSDNYGRTTNLTADNHGEKLIKTIQSSYGSGNELMFPVGNDPAYIDFVVCSTEDQRKKLLELLQERGLHEFGGKPIEQFVRVEKTFFEHPRDQTLERAVSAAVDRLVLTEQEKSLEAKLRAIAEPKLEAWVKQAAVDAIESQAPDLILNTAEKAAKGSADSLAAKAAIKAGDTHEFESLNEAVIKASLVAAKKTIAEQSVSLGDEVPSGPIDKVIRSTAKSAAEKVAQEAVQSLLSSKKSAALAAVPAGASDDDKIASVKGALMAVPVDAAIKSTQLAIVAAAEKAAVAAAETSVSHRLTKGVGKSVRLAAEASAVEAAEKGVAALGIMVKLEKQIADLVTEPAVAAAQKALATPLAQKLNRSVGELARATLADRVLEHAASPIEAFSKEVIELARAASVQAAEEFAKSTGGSLSKEDRAQAEVMSMARAGARLEADSKKVLEQMVRALPRQPINDAVHEAVSQAMPGIIGQTPKTAASLVVPGAAHEAALRLLRQRFTPLAEAPVQEAMAQGAADLVAALVPPLVAKVLEATSKAMAEHYVGVALKARIKAELASL